MARILLRMNEEIENVESYGYAANPGVVAQTYLELSDYEYLFVELTGTPELRIFARNKLSDTGFKQIEAKYHPEFESVGYVDDGSVYAEMIVRLDDEELVIVADKVNTKHRVFLRDTDGKPTEQLV